MTPVVPNYSSILHEGKIGELFCFSACYKQKADEEMTLSWRQGRAVLCLYPRVLPVSVTHRGTTFCVFLLSLEQEIVLPTDRNGEGMASLNVHVEQRLRTDPLVWLITVRPDGRPYIVPV